MNMNFTVEIFQTKTLMWALGLTAVSYAAEPLGREDVAIELHAANAVTTGPDDFDFTVHVSPGNTDGDCDIDITDFNTLVRNFDPIGARGVPLPNQGNFDGDDDVDIVDFNAMVFGFNPTGRCGDAQATLSVESVPVAIEQAVPTEGSSLRTAATAIASAGDEAPQVRTVDVAFADPELLSSGAGRAGRRVAPRPI